MSDQHPPETGAILTAGPSDWQVIQRGADGTGRLELGGRWISDLPGSVMVRVVDEATGMAIAPHLAWQPATTRDDGTWSAVVDRIPAGGLYRLETRFDAPELPPSDRSLRGDMRHWLGVGDVWVIAGQSNAAGYGRGPVHDPPELGLHLFRNDQRWGLATHPMNESTGAVEAETIEQRNPGHSPFLHVARRLSHALGHPIGLVQTARGGSRLSEWNPTDPEPSGALFRIMVERVAAAGGAVRGMFWYQGEAEGNALEGEDYARRLGRAIGAWREALAAPDLPIVMVQLNRHRVSTSTPEADLHWSLVREAQRSVAHTTPGVTIVPSLDLPLSDEIHTSPIGNMLLAARLADAALGAVHGRGIDYLAPDVQNAMASADGRSVDLVFAPVTSHMGTNDDRAIAFRVDDTGGEAPVVAVAYPGDATVRLVLARPIEGPAVVHGAVGVDPATVPIDVDRQMPILGFHGVAITQHERKG